MSRSWFKIHEIQKKFKILKKNNNILELGCHPGGWTKYIEKKIGKRGKIFCCDIIKTKIKKNINFIKGNICNKKTIKKINKSINKINIDSILSDISPNLTGIKEIDNNNHEKIIKQIIKLKKNILSNNGNLIIKTFKKKFLTNFIKKIKKKFKNIYTYKPISSRKSSKEIYLIAKRYKQKNK